MGAELMRVLMLLLLADDVTFIVRDGEGKYLMWSGSCDRELVGANSGLPG